MFEENEDDYHDAICNDSSWETSSQPDDIKEQDLGNEEEEVTRDSEGKAHSKLGGESYARNSSSLLRSAITNKT